MQYELTYNPRWPLVSRLPKVLVETAFNAHDLRFIFDVTEPHACFRQACFKDGDPCWQDSCVEVFLVSTVHSGYFNFECSSSGACLAEHGQSRAPRRVLTSKECRQIRRTVLVAPDLSVPLIHWSIEIEIPRSLLGISEQSQVYGNLYKCASSAETPHYLSAFPIATDAPDFHRPEFFKEIKG